MLIGEKINELRELVKKHDLAYASGKPLITDTEYDKLYMELVDLESEHPEFYDENSPTQKIYDVVVEGLKKVTHRQPMLSQDKINDEAGLDKFINKQNDKIIVQQKLDGLTVVLTYQNGVLVQSVTRGNGFIGEDILHTTLNTANVPKKINFEGELEVRAEALITYVYEN